MRAISAPPRVTSVDVARRAGVSQSTVSLVLSGKAAGRISARTEEAVSAAAKELGYRPNVAARALRTGVARSVALVVPDITNPFFGRVLEARSAPPSRPATPSCSSTSATTARGRRRACARCSPARPTACCCSRSTSRPARPSTRSRSRCARTGCRSSGSTSSGRRPRARPPVRARPHAASPTSRRASTRRPSTSGATGCASGSGTRRRRSRRRSRSTARPRRPARCSTRAASRRSSATTTSSPAASTWPRANAASASRASCRVVGFDDLDFARVLAPPLTTVAIDAEGLGAAAFERAGARDRRRDRRARTGHARPARGPRIDCPTGLARRSGSLGNARRRGRSRSGDRRRW